MEIISYQLGQIGTNAYLILPKNSDEALLVDCPMGAASTISKKLKSISRKLSAILITHGHWDHIWDVHQLAASSGAKVYASKYGSPLIEDADFQREVLFADDGLKSAKIDVKVGDGDVLENWTNIIPFPIDSIAKSPGAGKSFDIRHHGNNDDNDNTGGTPRP